MTKSAKSPSKKSTKKVSDKKVPSKKPATPKKAPKATLKKPAAKSKPRGRTATYEAPREPEPAPVPTIDTPPTPEAEPPRAEVIVVEKDADGREPIPRPTMTAALKYAHAVVPKEDGLVYYTHTADGAPVVSGHDEGASFTYFLPPKAVWELNAAVPRKDSVRFLKLLEGLPPSAMVRVYRDGRAVIRHDTGQPEITFALGDRLIVDAWQPPLKGVRPQAEAPLRMDAGRAQKARKIPDAIARSWQSADGIEWVDVSDAETGATLARAVIAEDGRDLCQEDSRQTEFPGSRTAGTNTTKMREVPAEMQPLRDELAANNDAPTEPTAAEVTFETDAVDLDLDAPPVAPTAPTLPAPPNNTTRLRISGPQWNDLDDEGRARLAEPEDGASIKWAPVDGYFCADVPEDLVSIVRATADELVVFFAEDVLDVGAQAEETAAAQ